MGGRLSPSPKLWQLQIYFFFKKRSQGTKEMKRGTCFFDACSFIALDVGAVEPCLINPGIWEVYQTLRGIKTSLMLSATVCSSCHFPSGSHSPPGAVTGQKKRFLHSSPGSSLSLSLPTHPSLLLTQQTDTGLSFCLFYV